MLVMDFLLNKRTIEENQMTTVAAADGDGLVGHGFLRRERRSLLLFRCIDGFVKHGVYIGDGRFVGGNVNGVDKAFRGLNFPIVVLTHGAREALSSAVEVIRPLSDSD